MIVKMFLVKFTGRFFALPRARVRYSKTHGSELPEKLILFYAWGKGGHGGGSCALIIINRAPLSVENENSDSRSLFE